ncbi:VOC family protein [Nonomuraea sp. NPDC049419]|uniref:VOC family protein n=1 Tax=Nonomuraea sp. NPDC049419 TaxID=3155772 RepID=UPI00341D7A3F
MTDQQVIPYLTYQDAAAAAEWLAKAFGFEEVNRVAMPDGKVGHLEMRTAGGGRIMMAEATPDYHGPRRHAEECEAARRWLSVPYVIDGVLVHVDDVDAHYRRARDAGARILSEPETSGYGKVYRVEDTEGHRWLFTQA